MLKATRLTGKGSLMDATRLIQRTLSSLASSHTAPSAGSTASPAHPNGDVTDVEPKPARHGDVLQATPVTVAPARPVANAQATSLADTPQPLKEPLAPNFVLSPSSASSVLPVSSGQSPSDPISARTPPAPVTVPAASVQRLGAFTESIFQFKGEPYVYRLYIPASLTPSNTAVATGASALLPLVVLLHGCKQNALDFAKGTGMNLLADQQQVVVLYPEQLSKANRGNCWNWFEPTHQTRSGEPGMIAALTRKILTTRHGDVQIDPDRVYIAGLSAGGAMAAVAAELYPDIFAAVGVHSGLPAGAAQSMMGAFSAMRRGGPVQTATAMPTIVFHGSADTTVHPDNGAYVSDAARAALGNDGVELVKTEQTIRTQGLRSAQRVSYLDNSGKPCVEHWTVGDGGHAWSGGSAAGSYTDPQGPSASRAMLAFFMQHEKQKPS